MSWDDVPARWDVSRAHTAVARVELWSSSQPDATLLATLDATDPEQVISATVTDKWVTGVRRTLAMTVPFTENWVAWSKLPGPVVRPYAGMAWGQSEYLCPMGRFVFEPPQLSYPRTDITINGTDYWQGMTTQKELYAVPSAQGFVRDVVANLISGAGLGEPVVDLSSYATVPDIVWNADTTMHSIAVALLGPTSGEAFIDRLGVAHEQDRVPTIGRPLTDGETGTIISIGTTPDWSNVINEIAVTSSNTDVHFFPATATITDPESPAHWTRIGHRGTAISSPLLTTYEQALAMAHTELTNRAAASVSWPITAIPDPSRDAGDLITVTTEGLGSITAVVQEVKHDLTGGPMTLTLGAAV